MSVELLGLFCACVEPDFNLSGCPQSFATHLLIILGKEVDLPATYVIDADRKLVVTRIWGAATEDEIFDHGQRLRNDPQFKPEFRQLVDMSELTEMLIGREVIRDASRNQFFSPGVRRALVANTDAAFGMAHVRDSLGGSGSNYRSLPR
jgi:hypothetical protein